MFGKISKYFRERNNLKEKNYGAKVEITFVHLWTIRQHITPIRQVLLELQELINKLDRVVRFLRFQGNFLELKELDFFRFSS